MGWLSAVLGILSDVPAAMGNWVSETLDMEEDAVRPGPNSSSHFFWEEAPLEDSLVEDEFDASP